MTQPHRCFTLTSTLYEGFDGRDIVEQRRSNAEERTLYASVVSAIGDGGLYRYSGEHEVGGATYRVTAVRSGEGWAVTLAPVIPVVPQLSSLNISRSDLYSLAEPNGLTLVCSSFGNGKTSTLFSLTAGMSSSVRGRTCYLVDRPEFMVGDKYSVTRLVGRDVETFADGIHDAIHSRYHTIVVDSLSSPATADAALYAASLGHRVLAACAADSVIGGLRLLYGNVHPDDHRRVPRALSGVWAQRLVKTPKATYVLHESVMADSALCRVLGSRRIEPADISDAIVRQGRIDFWSAANRHIRDGFYDRPQALKVLSENEGAVVPRSGVVG